MMKTLIFDITRPAPTQKMLDAVLSRQRTLVLLDAVLLAIGIVVGLTSVFVFDRPGEAVFAIDHGRNIDWLGNISYGAMGGFLLTYQALATLMFALVPSHASPMSPSLSDEMDAYCAASETSRHYADEVRMQGRPFVLAEFSMMRRAWSKSQLAVAPSIA